MRIAMTHPYRPKSPVRGRRIPLFAAVLAGGLALSAALFPQPAVAAPTGGVDITAQTVNGRTDPLGISVAAPSFGWKYTADRRGVEQTAYELRVGTSPGSGDVWATGRVDSADQVDVEYEGPALAAASRYHWSVRVWDDTGSASDWSDDAWFETGLQSAGDWGDADWIGRTASSFEQWRDYRARVDFDLNRLAFGLYVRAQDPRNAYMWQINVGDSDASVPLLRPHRLVNGQWTLLGEVDLRPFGFDRQGLLDGTHSLEVAVEGDRVITRIDDREVDSRTDGALAYGGVGVRTFGAESVTIRGIRVAEPDGTVLAEPSLSSNPFSTGTVQDGAVVIAGTADAYLGTPDENAAPLLRTEFDTTSGKAVASARVYASARGVYELSLNGQKVGDQFLAPGYTEYQKRILSQTYDVTDLVRDGTNAFGAALGDGWWAGKVGLAGKYQYGSDLSVIARLRVVYTDGTEQWIDTDDSWQWAPGPFLATDNQLGETYDARYARAGWNSAGFDSGSWADVAVRPSDTAKLSPQGDEPVRETQVLDALSYTAPQAGARIYDVGQNMVGVPRVTLSGRAGETVKIRHAEVLNPDGTMYTANLRAALATDYYTFATDGRVTYQPTFTQHGFRFIEISGIAALPDTGAVKGVVLGSDLPLTGDITSSSALVNQLVSNIRWGARGNFLSIPTDTPARDERLGWTGDINVFAPTAAYLFDTRAFLAKWMTDVRDEQKPSGSVPSVVPSTNGAFDETGVAWEDAILTVPHSLWEAYGDTSVVRENWDAMEKFFDYARASAGDDNLEPGRATWFSGDWLHLDDPSDQGVLGTAVWAQDVQMMADMAEAIGKADEAREYRELYDAVRRSFTEAYVSDDGVVRGDSQTGYALALGLDLIDDADLQRKAGDKYVEKLARTDNHLRTGFVGTPWLLPALSNIGREDLAYEILLKDTYPSWGYEISKGATTVWERWNSIQPDGSFGPVDMNSFNHYAYGAVGDWMAQNVAGLRIGSAGYGHSVVAPRPGGGLTTGGGTVDTVYGTLSSAWTLSNGALTLDVTVPAGSTAEVRVPSTAIANVSEGGVAVRDADGVGEVSYDAATGVTSVQVGSGTYSFVASADAVRIATATAQLVGDSAADVSARVVNDGENEVSGILQATSADGWSSSSSTLSILAGSEATVTSRMRLPDGVEPGSYPLSLRFVSGDTTLASGSATLVVPEPGVPSAEQIVDHVDFGEATSERAHAVMGSPSSGVNTEAGLTRRYADNGVPGSWYEASVAVDPGSPIRLRVRETWNTAGTKNYRVYIDGELAENVVLTRSGGSGQSSTFHDVVVTDPAFLDNDGTVTVRFEYPSEYAPRQYYDPSIADLWSLSSADVLAPTLSTSIESAQPAVNGWYRSLVTVRVDAEDDRAGRVSIQQRSNGVWEDVNSPVTVDRDGTNELAFRSTDAAGNISDTVTVTARLDRAAPTSVVRLSPEGGEAITPATATATFTASDATSGVAYTEVSNDGQASWTRLIGDTVSLDETGVRTVHYRSVDTAGNVEQARAFTLRVGEPGQIALFTVDVGKGSVVQGGELPVTVTGLKAGEQIHAMLFSDPLVVEGILAADASGTTTFTLRIPRLLLPGSHTLVVERPSGERVSVPITVVAASPGTVLEPAPLTTRQPLGGLAATGTAAPVLAAALGLFLIAAGASQVVRQRRR